MTISSPASIFDIALILKGLDTSESEQISAFGRQEWFKRDILKFGYSEKATKFEKKLPLKL